MFEFLAIIVFIYGLFIGSYFNVVLARVPLGLSVLTPSSACPKCHKRIAWYYNIPVISYLILRGKCAHCSEPISLQYPFVELLTGTLALLSYISALQLFGDAQTIRAASFAWLVIACIPIFVVDIKHYLIPDSVVIPGIILGLAAALFSPHISIFEAAIGGSVAGGALFVFGLVVSKLLQKEALGFGDVKLLAMVGVFTGLDGALLSIVLASIVGLICTVIIKLIKRESKDIPLPFGPYIIAAALPVFLWKNEIIKVYFDLVLNLAN